MLEKTLLDRFLQSFKKGTLTVHFWDGTTTTYGSGLPKATLTIKTHRVFRAMVRDVPLAVGEAYMDGTIDIEPLDNFFQIVNINRASYTNKLVKLAIALRHTQRNHKGAHKRQIQHHYDLGNDFYKMWLDNETMAYTCAYYKTPQDSLEKAQVQKFEHVLRKLQIKPGQHLLDIGCGWGHLLVKAAKDYKATGLGVTLSAEQYAYATELAKQQGVDKQIKFELLDYQDLADRKPYQYDRVYSVGILEHVGRGNYDTYFDVVDKMLKPGGISFVHTISQEFPHRTDKWLDKYIFPGGYLPTVSQITERLPEHNFRLMDYENIRLHYAMTLDEWWRRYEKHSAQVIKMFDERFYRMWRFWLAASASGFRYGNISLSHFLFTKGLRNDLPLTRDYMYSNKK
jgi:cyclopropane-fatty-acyl-phospholipid synthase